MPSNAGSPRIGVERGVAAHRRAQRASAVARLAELELELKDEVAVFPFAHQPGAARVAALENATLDFPHDAGIGGLAHVIPTAHSPAGRSAVLGKERNESGGINSM
jgi:hypothetical protein